MRRSRCVACYDRLAHATKSPLGASIVIVALALAMAAPDLRATERPLPQTNVGIEGQYFLRDNGSLIEAVPVDDKAAMILRIADVQAIDNTRQYDVRYIGRTPGEYDLRDFLRRVDGGSLEDIGPIRVQIVGLLPDDHTGDITPIDDPALPAPGGYRIVAALAIVVWFIPIVYLLFRAIARKRDAEEDQAPAPLTLADQLRPLVERAIDGELDIEGKARLERLLIGYWRTRLDLTGLSTAAALKKLHEHETAGDLLTQLENWLHRRPVGQMSNAERRARETDLQAALTPYANVAAVEEPPA